MSDPEASKELFELPKDIDQPHRGRIKKLIKALRSGNYIQGKGQNKHEDRYCCLGVGCDIFRKETNEGEWVERHDLGDGYFKIGDYEAGYILPKEVKEWFGFQSQNPYVIVPPEYRDIIKEELSDTDSSQLNLGTLNDSFLNFDQIAHVLEFNYLSEE